MSAARSKVPFHIPTIPRPQDEFNILVNNSNQPFEHVWLERSEDGSRFVHPLEKLSALDFVNRNIGEGELVKPLPIERCPFKLVEGVKELKELTSKLQDVKEFAVDLEHNHYRSFQGLTCLMQISTRTEDFIVDTLKLRVYVGPYLREIFKDPSKGKVMHGADRDILWLQRDFGIYVCNLFDTGQASRVLQLERNSLEYLLYHFCGVSANKEYQNADWRLRPLPYEMLKYAREDTHYLLHIYDLMRHRLLSTFSDSENGDALVEVYNRSYDICMQFYEKELLTDASYLRIYGLQDAGFNSQQLAIAAGLCKWRDNVSRVQDESTGYILPNKALLEIARHIPLSSCKVRQIVKCKYPFVEVYLNDVIAIIRSSVENAFAYEGISEELKKEQLATAPGENIEAVVYNSEPLPIAVDPSESAVVLGSSVDSAFYPIIGQRAKHVRAFIDAKDGHVNPVEYFSDQVLPMSLPEMSCSFRLSETARTTDKQTIGKGSSKSFQSVKEDNVASAPMIKRQSGALAALFGNASSTRNFNLDKRDTVERDKKEVKVEQIKSLSRPFHSFSVGEKHLEPSPEGSIKHSHPGTLQRCSNQPAEAIKLEEAIPLETEAKSTESSGGSAMADDGSIGGCQSESDLAKQPVSLSELSSGFESFFKSVNQRRSCKRNQRPSQ